MAAILAIDNRIREMFEIEMFGNEFQWGKKKSFQSNNLGLKMAAV